MDALRSSVATTQSLLASFTTFLSSPNDADYTPPSNPPNALSLLSDSAKILKAQTTKLSLLTLNKPFTPSAVAKVLTEVNRGCLSGLMAAVQLCDPVKYGHVMQKEVISRVRTAVIEFSALVQEIPIDDKGKDIVTATGRDTLSSTGVVWEACDALVELQTGGLARLVVKKAEEYRALLADAIKELEEWGDSTQDEDDEETASPDFEDDFGDDSGFGIPSSEVQLAAQLTGSLILLRRLGLLYPAVAKRRLKRFTTRLPASESEAEARVAKVDDIMRFLEEIPEKVDEAAEAFYDLNGETAETCIDRCRAVTLEVLKLSRMSWEGNEDEFTPWSDKLASMLAALPQDARYQAADPS